jgi:hypothetical protein
MKKQWVALLVAVGAAAAMGGLTCKASITTGCEGGTCTSSSVGSGAGGGCAVPTSTDADKHGFPDDVYAVLKKNCFPCHGDPLQNHAPHTFFHYHDTQCIYYASNACIACAGDHACLQQNNCNTWWSQQKTRALPDPTHAGMMGYDDVGRAVVPMPLGKPPIPVCDQQVLRTWFATCGDDPTATDVCAKGVGTAVGDPCAEDMAGASSSSSTSTSTTSTSSSATTSSATTTSSGG